MPSQQELDAFWWGTGGTEDAPTAGAYVTMNASAFQWAYFNDATFRANYIYCRQHHLYGFSQYPGVAGDNQVGSGGQVVNGPTQS